MRVVFRGPTGKCLQNYPYALALYRQAEMKNEPRRSVPLPDGYGSALIDISRTYIEINTEVNPPPP